MVLDSCVHITQGDVDRANVEALPWTSAADRPLWEAAKFVRARLGTNGLRQLPVLPDSYKPAERNSLTMRHAGPLTRAVPRFDTNDNAWHRAFGEATGDFVFGHRHESAVKHLDGSVLICTGSVGGPFDGDPRASYGGARSRRGSSRSRTAGSTITETQPRWRSRASGPLV